MTGSSQLPNLPLHALRAFEAASRTGSFKAAAAELAVTPAAISHQIKALEARLGLSLFERLHRSLRITPAGALLGEATRTAFSSLERVLEELTANGSAAGPRTLSVSAAPSFAAKWLAPRIHRFQARHPNVQLRLLAGDALVDLTNHREIDVALRYGYGPYGANLKVEKLWASGEIIAVCAPSLVRDNALRTPRDLLNFSLLRIPTLRPRLPDEGTPLPGWPAWLAAAGVDCEGAERKAADGPLFGSTHLAVEAAAAGRGVALAPAILVKEDLRTGRLAQPFETSISDPCSYWMLCRRDRAEEGRIRAFTRWILDEAAISA